MKLKVISLAIMLLGLFFVGFSHADRHHHHRHHHHHPAPVVVDEFAFMVDELLRLGTGVRIHGYDPHSLHENCRRWCKPHNCNRSDRVFRACMNNCPRRLVKRCLR